MQADRPAASNVPQKMTFEEFLAWDGGDETKHWEWVDGEVIQKVTVSARHSQILSFLITLLAGLIDARELGMVLFDPFVMYLSARRSGRAPDLLFIRTENKDKLRDNYFEGPADLVIEIVSPGSTKTDYLLKRAEYQRGGVREYWIIDPLSNTTTFLLLSESGEYIEVSVDTDGRFASPALDGFLIDPKWFHQDPLPKVMLILKEWGVTE
jgi:Uma2 family endonuclease